MKHKIKNLVLPIRLKNFRRLFFMIPHLPKNFLFARIIAEKIFLVDKNFFDKALSDKYNENQFSLREF